jgi:DNA polymerase III delta prime subunit
MSVSENVLWTERYRPQKVADAILPVELKTTFQNIVDSGEIPNLLLTGKGGVGKTTVARAMCEELSSDYIIINSSMRGNIDTLRNEILSFASAVSLSGGRKMVILDEADYLNATSTQPALRNFMEEFSRNCGFILTANYPSRIIPEIHSRCACIDFKIPKAESSKLASGFFKRVLSILNDESVTYDKAVVAEIISMYFPDCRRVLNELQRYSILGNIDTGLLASLRGTSIDALVEFIKKKNFTDARKWVSENMDSTSDFFRKFYDSSTKHVKASYVPALVLLIAKYQYQASFVADQEINACAFVAELMLEQIYE